MLWQVISQLDASFLSWECHLGAHIIDDSLVEVALMSERDTLRDDYTKEWVSGGVTYELRRRACWVDQALWNRRRRQMSSASSRASSTRPCCMLSSISHPSWVEGLRLSDFHRCFCRQTSNQHSVQRRSSWASAWQIGSYWRSCLVRSLLLTWIDLKRIPLI